MVKVLVERRGSKSQGVWITAQDAGVAYVKRALQNPSSLATPRGFSVAQRRPRRKSSKYVTPHETVDEGFAWSEADGVRSRRGCSCKQGVTGSNPVGGSTGPRRCTRDRS